MHLHYLGHFGASVDQLSDNRSLLYDKCIGTCKHCDPRVRESCNFSAFPMVIACCDDCSVLVAGWSIASPVALPNTCVRQRACIRSPSTPNAFQGGELCVVRIFARAREPTRLAHGFLRRCRLHKTCGYRFCSRKKMFKLMATDICGRINIEFYKKNIQRLHVL